jgi:uncharacterized membrane protein HdeD (DUF308 family)
MGEDLMKPKLLFTFSAIYMGLIGLTVLISPVVVMGLDAGTSAHLIAQVRVQASLYIGIAVVNWFARNAEASKGRDAIFLGNSVVFGLMAILFGLLMFTGEPVTGWVIVVIDLLFAVAFFVIGRANMSTRAS